MERNLKAKNSVGIDLTTESSGVHIQKTNKQKANGISTKRCESVLKRSDEDGLDETLNENQTHNKIYFENPIFADTKLSFNWR